MGAGLRGDSSSKSSARRPQKILDGQSLLGDRVTAIEQGRVTPGADIGAGDHGADADCLQPCPGRHLLIRRHRQKRKPKATRCPPPAAPGSASTPTPPTERQVGAIGAATNAVAAEGGAAGVARSKKANRTIYLPPGFMKARLLTGIDALASRDATSNPEPIIARVQAPAVLPNDVKANLSDVSWYRQCDRQPGEGAGRGTRACRSRSPASTSMSMRSSISRYQRLLRRRRWQEGPVRQGGNPRRGNARALVHRRHDRGHRPIGRGHVRKCLHLGARQRAHA